MKATEETKQKFMEWLKKEEESDEFQQEKQQILKHQNNFYEFYMLSIKDKLIEIQDVINESSY